MCSQDASMTYPVTYPNTIIHPWPHLHGPPPVPTYIFSTICTDQVSILVTTISCPLWQSNGSLTCPFAGGVTAGVHNEGGDIFIPLRWMTKMTEMTKKLKSRPWEQLPEVYKNTVILVTRLKKTRIARLFLAFSIFALQPKNWTKVWIEKLKQNNANAFAWVLVSLYYDN